MKTTVEVRNVMACGCRNSVHRGLSGVMGVFGVEVDPARGRITVEHTDEATREQIEEAVREMGYEVVPPKEIK